MTQPDVPDHVQSLVEDFKRSGLRELHARTTVLELRIVDANGNGPTVSLGEPVPLSDRGHAVAVEAVPIERAATPEKVSAVVPDGTEVVTAPYLGTFYRSPKPGSAAYVDIGSSVSVDSEVCLVEVMKLFTAVRAGHAGTIVAILADDGQLVSPDQPLFAIEVG